jgi:hypothetical protein
MRAIAINIGANTNEPGFRGPIYPDGSRLYERGVPLSRPEGGIEAGALVTRLSEDSGRGPWWRRPLRFEDGSARRLVRICASPTNPGELSSE